MQTLRATEPARSVCISSRKLAATASGQVPLCSIGRQAIGTALDHLIGDCLHGSPDQIGDAFAITLTRRVFSTPARTSSRAYFAREDWVGKKPGVMLRLDPRTRGVP
jgi:hypothetical protein